jgi:hypothetical protein
MAINRWGLIRDIDNGQDWRAEEHVQFTPLSQVAPQGRPNRINYMKNQRQHGACTGFMRTRLQRMALQKAGLADVDLSELHAYWWNRVYSGLNPNLDTGASIRGSLDAGRAKGACREAWWTYANADGYLNVKPEAYADEDALNYQILESYTLPNNPDAIMQALNDGFGVQGFGRITFDYITKYAFDIWAVRANESPVPTPSVADAILGHSFGASQTVPDVTTVDMKQGNTVIRVWPRAQGASPAAQAHAALHASTGRGSEDDTLP